MTKECHDCHKAYDTTAMYEIRRPTLEVERLMREQGRRYREVHRFYLCVNCWNNLLGAAMYVGVR